MGMPPLIVTPKPAAGSDPLLQWSPWHTSSTWHATRPRATVGSSPRSPPDHRHARHHQS